MAWQSDSPLWAAINTLHQVPSCEEVTVPQNIEHAASSAQTNLRSPIIHPRVERISGEEGMKRGLILSIKSTLEKKFVFKNIFFFLVRKFLGVPSSPAVSAHDRFSSPVHPGRAVRNLFSGGSGTSAMTTVPTSLLNSPPASTSSTNQTTNDKPGKKKVVQLKYEYSDCV